MEDIAAYMKKHWEKRGFESMRQFCTASETNVATLSLAIKGERAAPQEHVIRWADTLHLRGEEKEAFIQLWQKRRVMGRKSVRDYAINQEVKYEIVNQKLALGAALVTELTRLATEFGAQISPNLKKRIKVFVESVKPLGK